VATIFAPEARICSAGDKARQFVVQRLFTGPSRGPVPFALWVEPEPIRMKHRDCTCRIAFAVTAESARQRMGRNSTSYVVCPCDRGQLKFRRGQLEFPGDRRAEAIQVGDDLYGEQSAGETALAADTEVVAGDCGSEIGDGLENGAEIPAGSTIAERDATKAYLANAAGSVRGYVGRDSAVSDGRARFTTEDAV